jgi:hypothetical protein
MPYDSSLDKCLFSKSLENEQGRVTVSVYSYNNGPKKLQVSRETKDREGNLTFGKLGRISKEEIEGLMPFLKEALGHM